MQTFTVRTRHREEFCDITEQVRGAIAADGHGGASGLCLVFVPHTTAALTINENADPSVVHDMLARLRQLVPPDAGYTHSEGNSDAHIKASMMGASATVPVVDGKLALGTWQGIYLCEFDGPRTRHVYVQTLARE